MAAVETRHPDYTDRADEWAMMRHCERGPQAVKGEAERYLPKPSGFTTQADGGRAMYSAYQTRAQFPDILAPTLRGMVGVIHRTEAQIEMPTALEPLWERATVDGLPLEAFHRRITGELLLMGRYGLLADVRSEGSDLPFLAGYTAETLTNWSAERNFFVLDESGPERDEFEWKDVKRFRVLKLTEGGYVVQVYEGADLEASEVVEPKARADSRLDQIPFVIIGSRDISVDPDEPPLIGVARSSLAIYRLDADYRHQLYMSGQETLFVINGKAPAAIGAGVVVELDGAPNLTPDAKYVGPSGSGIAAHRIAIQDEREAAVAAGARVFDSVKKAAESGEALRLRQAANTATLTSIAQASAAGLEKALRFAAIFVGANPEEVVVTPNLKFQDTAMTPADAEALVRVWQGGAISKLSLFENLQRGELISVERGFEAEEALIETENPIGGLGEDLERAPAEAA